MGIDGYGYDVGARYMIRIVERIHVDGAMRIIPVDERLIWYAATNKPVMDSLRCVC